MKVIVTILTLLLVISLVGNGILYNKLNSDKLTRELYAEGNGIAETKKDVVHFYANYSEKSEILSAENDKKVTDKIKSLKDVLEGLYIDIETSFRHEKIYDHDSKKYVEKGLVASIKIETDEGRAAKIQDVFLENNIRVSHTSYNVTDESKKKAEKKAIENATKEAIDKIEITLKSLNKGVLPKYDIKNVNINNNSYHYPMMPMVRKSAVASHESASADSKNISTGNTKIYKSVRVTVVY